MALRVRSSVRLSRPYRPSHILAVVWVGYAFYAVPVICVLARLHVAAGGK